VTPFYFIIFKSQAFNGFGIQRDSIAWETGE